MARILYGVMGDAGGHVNRARILIGELSRHEFVFVGGGKVCDLGQLGFHVHETPMASTYYRHNRVDVTATVRNAVGVFALGRRVVRGLTELIRDYDPDLILTDYEYFTPIAAHAAGRECLSVDHQHVITHCVYDPPREQVLSRLTTSTVIRRFYSRADRYAVVSFFRPPAVDPVTVKVFPPVVRRKLFEFPASDGEDVLVYQTSPTFGALPECLKRINRRFTIYGMDRQGEDGNLVYKGPSEEGFLRDMAESAYVIANGGHNVISEALFFGKPVLSFPIAGAYEQFLNAFFLNTSGYGDYSTDARPSPQIVGKFEQRLSQRRAAIRRESFFGNDLLAEYLELLLSERSNLSRGSPDMKPD